MAVNCQLPVAAGNTQFSDILWKNYHRKLNYQRGLTIWLLVMYSLELSGHAIFPLNSAEIFSTTSRSCMLLTVHTWDDI